jgi:hypothetical protein
LWALLDQFHIALELGQFRFGKSALWLRRMHVIAETKASYGDVVFGLVARTGDRIANCHIQKY